MRRILVIILFVCCITALIASPVPGGKKHVKHRIHVPTKIHTVFVTKFIKVPEHHHHHHTVKKEHHHHGHHGFDEDNFDHEI